MALYIRGEKRMNAKTTAFLYRWTHVTTGMWYVGSRTAAGCHPEDGYICSSKQVKPLIIENANEWNREILVIGDSKYILFLENQYLTLLDAKNDLMSYNRHNGDGKFTSTGVILSNSTKQKMSNARKGKGLSNEHKKSISISVTKSLVNAVRGYYIDSTGQQFDRIQKAADAYGVTRRTIFSWIKNSKNGWSFKLKENA